MKPVLKILTAWKRGITKNYISITKTTTQPSSLKNSKLKWTDSTTSLRWYLFNQDCDYFADDKLTIECRFGPRCDEYRQTERVPSRKSKTIRYQSA